MGVVGVVANTWLPKLVESLRKRYPGLALRIDMSLTRVLVERLREGRLDVAIIAGQLSEPGVLSESLGFDDFVLQTKPRIPPVEFSLIHRLDRPHPLVAPIAAAALEASELRQRPDPSIPAMD